MIEMLVEIWTFMAEGVVVSLLGAMVLPLVGAILLLRRDAFLGVAVPQFSAAGIAIGLAVLPWFPALNEEFLDHGHPPMEYLFAFAAGAAGLALLLFSVFNARVSSAHRESGVAAGFALASAVALLALEFAPLGSNLVETLQRGSVVVADDHSVAIVGVVAALVLVGLYLFGPGILLVSFDRDGASALGHHAGRYEFAWNAIVGACIGVGVMTMGPVLVFGLLFLPPVGARKMARSMGAYFRWTGALSVLPVLLAWPTSFHFDLPFGPTAVACVAVFALPCLLLGGRLRPTSTKASR